jgi:diaminopimelate decarboxylase
MTAAQNSTTPRLDALMARHAEVIDQALDQYGIPLHVVFLEEIEAVARQFQSVGAAMYPKTNVLFAAKSNPCRGAIRTANRLGCGVDAASEYELLAALQEGVPPDRIVCNGNAKSTRYLELAARAGAIVALDNADEIEALIPIAQRHSASVRTLVRFRGMPLSGLTSDDQTTAADWTKFGFHIDEAAAVFRRVLDAPGLAFHGISAHIGTQIADPSGYERLLTHFFALADCAANIGLHVRAINIGGGYPVRFLDQETWEDFTSRLLARVRGELPVERAVTWNDLPMGYARVGGDAAGTPAWIGKAYWTTHPGPEMLAHLLEHRFDDGRSTVDRLRAIGSPTLIIEPGRSLMATGGITLTEVMGVKEILGHPVVSLEMGINNHGTNLISPDIFPAAVLPQASTDRPIEAFLAGRLCFSGDMISKAKIRLNRRPQRGERFVLYHTGAYSADHFASNSCGFPRPAKIAIAQDGALELWRAPERFADVFGTPLDTFDKAGSIPGDWREEKL